MKEILAQKLTSRKLWIAIIGIIVGLAATFGISDNDYAQVAGSVGSICSAIAYIIGEAVTDKAALSNPVVTEDEIEDETEGEDFNG